MNNPLTNKNIILGVTGSIAAYKATTLASKLTQSGAQVEVVLTESGCKFITPLSFQSVTARRAYTDSDLWGRDGHVTHIGLGHAADLMVVAPASANTIAKLANGIGDNLLSVTALAATCPLVIAPAMDAGMFSHAATQKNVEVLKDRGAIFIGPAAGHLASGLVGLGRFVEPEDILEELRFILSRNGPLKGKKVVVTAGGTQESIDPVRVITNHSSGKQGYSVAQAALDAGGDVTLIHTKTALKSPAGCKTIQTLSAADMLKAVLQESKDADILIMAAAVADFRPKSSANQKIKKSSGFQSLELEATVDILVEVSEQKSRVGRPLKVIGFAAESQNLLDNAKDKLNRKKLDMIVANNITEPGSGFGVDTNQVSFIYPDGTIKKLPKIEKSEVAGEIIQQILKWR